MEQRFDVLNRQGTNNGSGQKGNQQIASEHQLRAITAQDPGEQLNQTGAKNPDHGQNRTKLNDNLEDLGITRGKINPGAQDQQVRRTGNRNEFRDALNNPQKQGFQQIESLLSHVVRIKANKN